MAQSENKKYLYNELTHEIIGVCFKVFNELGPELRENVYQHAMAIEFGKLKISYEKEIPAKINYAGLCIGKRRFDFIVDRKVLVELKVRQRPTKLDYEQIHEYLKISGLKLGLLI